MAERSRSRAEEERGVVTAVTGIAIATGVLRDDLTEETLRGVTGLSKESPGPLKMKRERTYLTTVHQPVVVVCQNRPSSMTYQLP